MAAAFCAKDPLAPVVIVASLGSSDHTQVLWLSLMSNSSGAALSGIAIATWLKTRGSGNEGNSRSQLTTGSAEPRDDRL